MGRFGVACLTAAALAAAPARGVKLQPEQNGPIDDLLKQLKDGKSGGSDANGDANPLAGMMPNGGNPLAGMMPDGVPGMSMDQALQHINTAVAALNDSRVRDAAFNTLGGSERVFSEYLRSSGESMDVFANESGNMTDDDQAEIVELFQNYARDVVNASDKIIHQIMAGLHKDVMPLLPEELQQKAGPMLLMAEAGIAGGMLMAGDKIDKMSNMSMDEICQELLPIMHPSKGMGMIEKNLSRDLPMLQNSKAMLPMALPFISGRHPELMPVVSKLLSDAVDVTVRLGLLSQTTTHKFNVEVGPVISDKLHCVFTEEKGFQQTRKKAKHHHATNADGSNNNNSGAAAARPWFVLLVAAAASGAWSAL